MAAEEPPADPERSQRVPDPDHLADNLKALANARRLRLLSLLTKPRYLEELAEQLPVTRQAVRQHLDPLVELGVVRRRQARRGSSHVVEYVLDRCTLFKAQADFQQLGRLRSEDAGAPNAGTAEAPVEPGEAGHQRGRQPVLVLVHGLDRGRTFPLDRGVSRIGRSHRCDVLLDYDPFVSASHADVVIGEGRPQLQDAFSQNGTYRNFHRLEEGGSEPLRSGDVVGVGRSLLVYQGPVGDG